MQTSVRRRVPGVIAGCLAITLAGCSRKISETNETQSASAELNPNPKIGDFAIYATNSISINQDALVVGGDVGVKNAGSGPFLVNGFELALDQRVQVNPARSVLADSVLLNQLVIVGDVQTNQLTDRGATRGNVTPFIALPPFPTVVPVVAGASDLNVQQNATITLPAGASYRNVTIGQRATVRLAGGVYRMAQLTIGQTCRVEALATAEIRVAGRLAVGQTTYLGTKDPLSAKELRVEISGINGATGNVTESPPAASIGQGGQVRALLLVPDGRLDIAQNVLVQGAAFARDVKIGQNTQVSFQDGVGGGACPPSCDDGNACTTDACTAGACTHAPVNAGFPCSDGDACNGNETCSAAGTCIAGSPITCAASTQCQLAGTCNPATGLCTNPAKPDGTACDDGNTCTANDICQAGTCRPGPPVPSDDGNPCTTDSCEPSVGVKHIVLPPGTPCPDGDACNGAETCDSAGQCKGGTPIICTALDACHDVGTCNPASGQCSNPVKPRGDPCDDGNACTLADSCQDGSCVGNPIICQALDVCHDVGVCIPSVGGCTNPAKPDTAPCNDGNACTNIDRCQAGTCVGSNPVTCPAPDQCHLAGTCDPESAGCSYPSKPDGTGCDDGNRCTESDTCVGGACTAGPPKQCPPETCQLAWSCNPGTGTCTSTPKPGGTCADMGIAVGRVVSDTNGAPVEGATIRIGDRSVLSGKDGRYAIGSDNANVLLVVNHSGFTTAERALALMPGVGTVPVDARLTPLPSPAPIDSNGASFPASLARVDAEPVQATLTVPPGAVPALATLYVTPLSPQGLPALLPLGWSPIVAFDVATVPPQPVQSALSMALKGLSSGALQFVFYDKAAHQWRLESTTTIPANGNLTLPLARFGSYALVEPDADGAPAIPAAGAPLPGVAAAAISPTVTALGAGLPNVLPAGGGLVQGRVILPSPVVLPSGTVVALAVSERFDLASGVVASSETHLEDLVLFHTPIPRLVASDGGTAAGDAGGGAVAPNGFDAGSGVTLLGATLPIVPSRTYDTAKLTKGNLHFDILAGRQATRGKIGGHNAVSLQDGDASLSVSPASLTDDTVIDLERTALADFVPEIDDLVPVAQVGLDFSAATLTTSAELTVDNLPATTDAMWLARLERVEGVAHPVVVAAGRQQGTQWIFGASPALPGILVEGTHVAYRSAAPVGFVAGTTKAAGTPVRALVSVENQPFVSVADGAGLYQLAAKTGSVVVRARVPGTNLAGSGTALVTAGQTAALDIALEGEITKGIVTPSNGAIDVPPTTQISVATSAPLDAQSVTTENVQLFASSIGNEPIAVRLSLNASATNLSVIPVAKLAPGTSYTLQITLRDAFGGPVSVPTTTFTTKSNTPLVFDPGKVVISMPGPDGNVTIDIPAGSLPPGSTVIITNDGNGVVIALTVGNDGSLHGTIPASIDDKISVTITDPLGNRTAFSRSQYNGADGRVAVGPGGGVVQGAGGVELRVPEGALQKGVVFKLRSLGPEAFPEPAGLQDLNFASGINVGATGTPSVFKKEVDLVFPKPPAAPDGAVYYVYRRIAPAGSSGRTSFEIVDHALIQGSGSGAKVVTASPPFPGFWGFTPNAPAGTPPTSINAASDFLLAWSYQANQPDIAVGALVRGRVVSTPPGAVSSQTIVAAQPAYVYLVPPDGSPPTDFTCTREDGTYALWVPFSTPNNARIAAVRDTGCAAGGSPPVLPCPTSASPSDTVACVTVTEQAGAAESTAPSWIKAYRRYFNANVSFLRRTAQPPAAVEIVVMREEGGQRTRTDGLVVVGQPLILGFSAAAANVQSVSIGHLGTTQSPNVYDDPRFGQPMGMDRIAEFTPGDPGTYTISATAVSMFSGLPSATVTFTFRAAAAGGDATAPVPGEPPAVLTARTMPSAGASHVPTAAFPRVTFTEPVRNLTIANNVRLQDLTDANGPALDVTLIGVGLDGLPVEIHSPDTAVTSLTIQPAAQLKFNTQYKLSLGGSIADLDDTITGGGQPARPLAPQPYEVTFTTISPQAIGGTQETFSTAGVVTLQDRAFVVQNNYTTGVLRAYDIADPTSPTEIPSAQRQMLGRPTDIDIQRDGSDGANVVVITGPANQSLPSNLRVYRVHQDDQGQLQSDWIAAATLSATAVEGIARRVAVKDNFAYVLTTGKGVQLVDLSFARTLFNQGGGDTSRIRVPFNTDGEGFGQEAVVATIPVLGANGRLAFLSDIKVAGPSDGLGQAVVAVTGEVPLVLLDSATGEILFQAPGNPPLFPPPVIPPGGPTPSPVGIDRGRAIALVRRAGRDVALIAGDQGSDSKLVAIDITNPAQPKFLGEAVGLERAIDLRIKEDFALVGGEQSTRIVNIANPAKPFEAGTIQGVAGRLSVAESGIVLASATSTVGGEVPLGGVRTAALGLLPTIGPVLPTIAREVTNGAITELETLDDIVIPVEVFNADDSIASATVQVEAHSVVTTIAEMTVALAADTVRKTRKGVARIARGFRIPTGHDITGLARIAWNGISVRSADRPLDIGALKLRVDSNNDTFVTDADDEVAQVQAFTFWNISAASAWPELVPSDSCGATQVFFKKDLADLATAQVIIQGGLRPPPVASYQVFLHLDDRDWFLVRKVGSGKAYLADAEASAKQVAEGRGRSCRSDAVGRIRVPDDWISARASQLLIGCMNCASGTPSTLKVEYSIAGQPPREAGSVKVDIQPIESLMTMYSARRAQASGGLSRYSPLPTFEKLAGWADLPSASDEVTMIVHGFNVSEAEAIDFSTSYLKRLYWVGHRVLKSQGGPGRSAWLLGLSWPGDSGNPITSKVNLPDDEFHAFQTGIPLSRLIHRLKEGVATRRVSLIAHSLGNIVVNSALLQDNTKELLHAYIMNEAAVTAEAFGPGLGIHTALKRQAEEQGYSLDDQLVDKVWVNQWDEIRRDHSSVPRRLWHSRENVYCLEGLPMSNPLATCDAPDVDQITIDDFDDWQRATGSDGDPSYGVRWSKYQNNRPWLAVFAPNISEGVGVRIYNTYNPRDAVVNGIWLVNAARLKPDFGVLVGLGGGENLDGRRAKFWATLKDRSTDAVQNYLWNGTNIPLETQIVQTRKWAELAYYFGYLAGAAGGTFVPELKERNYSLAKWASGDALHGKEPEQLIEVLRFFVEFPDAAEQLCLGNPLSNVIETVCNGMNAVVPGSCSGVDQVIARTVSEIAYNVTTELVAGASCGRALAKAVGGLTGPWLASHGFMQTSDLNDVWCAHELFRDLIVAGGSDPSRDATDPKPCPEP